MISGKLRMVISVILVALCLVLGGCLDLSQADKSTGMNKTTTNPVASSSTPIAPVSSGTPSKDQLIAFVTGAVAYAHANGREKALSEFSNPNGSFLGTIYIYAL